MPTIHARDRVWIIDEAILTSYPLNREFLHNNICGFFLLNASHAKEQFGHRSGVML